MPDTQDTQVERISQLDIGDGKLYEFAGANSGIVFDTVADAQAAIQDGTIKDGDVFYVKYVSQGGTEIDAAGVGYDNTDSGLDANNVQDAIDEVADNLGDISSASSATGTDAFAKIGNLKSELDAGKVISNGSATLKLYTIVASHPEVVNASTLAQYMFDTYFAGKNKNIQTFTVWAVNKTNDSRHTACAKTMSDSYKSLGNPSEVTYATVIFKSEPGAHKLLVEYHPLNDLKPMYAEFYNSNDYWGIGTKLNRTSGWYGYMGYTGKIYKTSSLLTTSIPATTETAVLQLTNLPKGVYVVTGCTGSNQVMGTGGTIVLKTSNGTTVTTAIYNAAYTINAAITNVVEFSAESNTITLLINIGAAKTLTYGRMTAVRII